VLIMVCSRLLEGDESSGFHRASLRLLVVQNGLVVCYLRTGQLQHVL
jgi:hypothetical protein